MRGGGTTSTGALNITRETSSNNRLGASASMRPNSVIAHGFNNSLSTKRSLGAGSKNYRAGDDENLNLLQKQVRSLQLEKEKMRELIEELKQTNELYQGEVRTVEEKLKSKAAQLHKFASQCKANAHKVFMVEQLLFDYKYKFIDLSNNQQVRQALAESGAESILQQRDDLQAKEEQLKAKLEEEVASILVNLKVDPQFVALREELISQVTLKEKLLDQQYEQLTFRVAEKEEDLQRLKLLFVEKLRELETSFNEISHEVVETDKVTQDVTAKRKQELQTLLSAKPMNVQSSLDRSMEAIIGEYSKDETQKQLEELIQANHDLIEENEKLKQQVAQKGEDDQDSNAPGEKDSSSKKVNDNLHAEMVIELNEQIDEAKQESDNLKMQLKLAKQSEGLFKKEIQGLKYDNKRIQCDLKDSKERFEKIKMEYQQQFHSLKTNSVAIKQQL